MLHLSAYELAQTLPADAFKIWLPLRITASIGRMAMTLELLLPAARVYTLRPPVLGIWMWH